MATFYHISFKYLRTDLKRVNSNSIQRKVLFNYISLFLFFRFFFFRFQGATFLRCKEIYFKHDLRPYNLMTDDNLGNS